MSISDSDYKLLWGRAAGMCSSPTCDNDLTVVLESTESYNIGEMAHIIAKKPGGPRGLLEGGSDAYANLILLCPTCHRRIDKAPPGQFPEHLLHDWKSKHEAKVRKIGTAEVFESASDLKHVVRRLLKENHALWCEFGPESEVAQTDPGTNLHVVWELQKLGTIVPNNQRIMNLVEVNAKLLTDDDYNAFLEFKNHATAFEAHQYVRLDSYPLFPTSFEKAFFP